jgi:hypothetical protein
MSLLLCDFFQGASHYDSIIRVISQLSFCVSGVAFALNFRWAQQGMMEQGKICVIQGIVSQVGDLGAAIWSTAISFHTFWLVSFLP